ncbi:DUF159-domain-containing protein [Xylona heveae TC161]|uniref:DUF159-domain-containing protein n=1 Tax=Xylona heveae (strain CBS 132557 / TC161) TaxID=1328760 RepID=A0A164ZCE1_XYLHT|nr:DUF159-domain-containing protein [Xylona heveae TC161]KZF18930.1 DUF159-domain-containing protein [Xylona heveae TC161]
MCGRYALSLRPREVRHRLAESNMPAEDAPEDDATRQSYNVAPGYYELVYRADVPDYGAGEDAHSNPSDDVSKDNHAIAPTAEATKYKLQAMKWGLIPFWTKRNPDYGSMMRTINCRDDSLIENRGMWTHMKQKKRCIVVCEGFYEWLKKAGGKEKIPHFVKRADGQLMCFAGLWDSVKFEDSDEKIYSYTIITTDSNSQLKFLHDRMPVILDNGSEALRTWLDPKRSTWSKELQSLLRPYDGKLECYAVPKEVGKVGNNSPSFVIPIASTENKSNIANFFANANKAEKKKGQIGKVKAEKDVVKRDPDETRETVNVDSSEDHAPVPTPADDESKLSVKRELESDIESERKDVKRMKPGKVESATEPKQAAPKANVQTRKTRSATSNNSGEKSPTKQKNPDQKITSFFKK